MVSMKLNDGVDVKRVVWMDVWTRRAGKRWSCAGAEVSNSGDMNLSFNLEWMPVTTTAPCGVRPETNTASHVSKNLQDIETSRHQDIKNSE